MFLTEGIAYFNPDEAARKILSANPGITQPQANSAAWLQGKRLLEQAIGAQLRFAFETTLGGRTITNLLWNALDGGMEVRIWYVGLASVDLHIQRVRARVARGGHNIPEEKIRERFDSSRLNLIQLLPLLTELRVFDNSQETDPHSGAAAEPLPILHMAHGRLVSWCGAAALPAWAKPILAAALKLST
jgi:predicted ABC-type ATPase